MLLNKLLLSCQIAMKSRIFMMYDVIILVESQQLSLKRTASLKCSFNYTMYIGSLKKDH